MKSRSMKRRSAVALSGVLSFALLGACSSVNDAVGGEPAPIDKHDGYDGYMNRTGPSFDVALGPKQETLLEQFKVVSEQKAELQRQLTDERGRKAGVEAELADRRSALERESSLRAQAEATVQVLQQKRRELEAQILSLSIEKAKLEQMHLHGKIAELQRLLENVVPVATEAAAPVGGK